MLAIVTQKVANLLIHQGSLDTILVLQPCSCLKILFGDVNGSDLNAASASVRYTADKVGTVEDELVPNLVKAHSLICLFAQMQRGLSRRMLLLIS